MSLISPVYNVCGSAALPVMYDSVALHYMALWTFVCGAALVWGVVHLRRNASMRRSAYGCEQAQAQLRQVLQHSREAIYKYDIRAQKFEFLSPACFSLTGLTAEELDALSFKDRLQLIHPDDQETVFRLMSELQSRSKADDWQGVIEYRLIHKDGLCRSMSDHLYISYDESGKAAVVSGSVRDVTQITRLEDSVRILERKFQESQKMAGLGLLASGIAHDFNNLMTVVLGNAELALLECGGTDDSVLDEIKRTTLRAAELANQMLVYTGKTTLVVSSINLSSVVREMGALLDVSISKKVKIEYCLKDDIPFVRGDVSQIRQVAMNLITNASEAIGDREGVIAISIHKVHLRAGELKDVYPMGSSPEGPYVRLEVSDTGSGMDEKTRQKIFNPLFTTKVSGRGLGLASLLNAVERHNGSVEVKSDLGRGTVFRVYFPVEKQAREDEVCIFGGEASDWRGFGTALIADDEEAILDVTNALLERLGFRVLTASNGMKAVDLYTEYAGDITFLLMDVNMPGLNGQEAVMRIRHINPKVPVLFMSGYPREEVMARFEQIPHTGFIKKPFQNNGLVTAVRTVLEASPGE
ncbi:hybrid sensor histidine kinase/response regulator [Tichowtungia aerotolerans]|uniref:histidine kinase n=1 Tax=Tichowtungia aerotolerans TaxID=2697043 RepID=A0A6P1M9D6_9BACT|nr:PAS domain-containing sensor histidine kinase [Tichowtungia aerotolerans]QHI68206.1 response regulator [Tichowtungia aerotolerans]